MRMRPEEGEKRKTASEIKDTTREILARNSGNAHGFGVKNPRSGSAGIPDEVTSDDLAVRIAQEVRKHRDEAATRPQRSGQEIRSGRSQQAVPAVSMRVEIQISVAPTPLNHHRQAAGTVDKTTLLDGDVASDAESTTDLDFTRNSRRAVLPTPGVPATKPAREEDSRDLTLLSFFDPNEMHKLRKEARRGTAERSVLEVLAPLQHHRMGPRPVEASWVGNRVSRTSLEVLRIPLPGTGPFNSAAAAGKTVRVQSPHTSDEQQAGDTSFLSNTSRRRRRAASAEGMTSAFNPARHHAPRTSKPSSIRRQPARPCDKDATIPNSSPGDRPTRKMLLISQTPPSVHRNLHQSH